MATPLLNVLPMSHVLSVRGRSWVSGGSLRGTASPASAALARSRCRVAAGEDRVGGRHDDRAGGGLHGQALSEPAAPTPTPAMSVRDLVTWR
jgi:hypothetical protein